MAVDPVHRLEIIEAVRVTKARYFRFIDQKRWDEFPALFVADVHIDTSDDWALMGADPARGISDGRDRFVARCARILADVQSVHHGHMQEIEVLDATRATAITAMFDRLEFADGRVQTGYGHYEEDYVLDADAWRIARMKLRRLQIVAGS